MVWFIVGTPSLNGESAKLAKEWIDSECLGAGSKKLGNIFELNFDKSKFKIGTLDMLMKLNDALGKVDVGLEALLWKIEKQAKDLNAEVELKIETADGKMESEKYIEKYSWDDTKFPWSRSLIDISTTIQERVKSIDHDIKNYIDEYSEANA